MRTCKTNRLSPFLIILGCVVGIGNKSIMGGVVGPVNTHNTFDTKDSELKVYLGSLKERAASNRVNDMTLLAATLKFMTFMNTYFRLPENERPVRPDNGLYPPSLYLQLVMIPLKQIFLDLGISKERANQYCVYFDKREYPDKRVYISEMADILLGQISVYQSTPRYLQRQIQVPLMLSGYLNKIKEYIKLELVNPEELSEISISMLVALRKQLTSGSADGGAGWLLEETVKNLLVINGEVYPTQDAKEAPKA